MNRLSILLTLAICAGCVNSEQRFERTDHGQSAPLALKLDNVSGVRDGETVNATIQFRGGADFAEISIAVNLGPPPRFIAGTYRAMIGGGTSAGIAESQSLAFLGGQNSMPSVGGVFILKDSENRPLYRVTMPATTIQRRVNVR